MNQPSRIHLNRYDGRGRSFRTVLLTFALLVLVACGSDPAGDVPENRQFANDPAPTRAATEVPTPAPTETLAENQQRPQVATPAALLRTRGAPSTLYTVSDGDLLILTVEDAAIGTDRVDLPDGMQVLAFDASPTGDRVGVLMALAGTGEPFVQFYNADGQMVGGPYTASRSATPGASPAASSVATPQATPANAGFMTERDDPRDGASISWVPQGNGVLVAAGDAVFSIDVRDGVQPVNTSGVEGEIVYAAMSPKGDQLLVQVALPDGTQGAYLIDQETGEIHELRALRTDEDAGISELVWLPSGNGVLFVEGELVSGVVMRGQLFSYLFRNEVPRLVATSGQGGPSATIRNVAVTPDGFSVAYDVSIRDVNSWSAHSLWVRSLKEDVPGIQVPVDAGEPLIGIAWSSEGLLWAQDVGTEEDPVTLNLLQPTGDVQPLSVDGTPGASPVASPVSAPSFATPVESPGATPLPAMTPVG